MTTREQEVTRALTSLADYLISSFDVVDLLSELTGDCARLLDIASSGLVLADDKGVLHVIAASSEATRDLQLYQLQREQGPCLECYRTGRSVSVPDIAAEGERWPTFTRSAREAGFSSVHAIPLHLQDRPLGALGMFGRNPGTLSPSDLSLAAALAHVAAIALVAQRVTLNRQVVTDQLQHALSSRVVLEQAKGLLAGSSDLDMDQAFRALRSFARDHNLGLAAVAAALVNRDVTPTVLLAHVREKDGRARQVRSATTQSP